MTEIEQVLQTLKEAEQTVGICSNLDQLQQVGNTYLGRKGSITLLLKSIKDIPPEERKSFGEKVNVEKKKIMALIQNRRAELLNEKTKAGIDFDITLPGIKPKRGTLHPITAMTYELNDVFRSLGFCIYEGPEISSEAYVFDHLNFPDDHPARESMDTYWIKGCEETAGAKRFCIRPHLTGASVRYMQNNEPPFRFVYPGKAYRSESPDASHERAFFQYEALMVDRQIPFSAGRLLVDTILERVFGQKVNIRMRAGFFPFVEPGFEIAMQCLVCKGKGCSVCKQVGWIEIMPGGPPHPNVMRAGGIDPSKWQGFYINVGLDRLTMMKHKIPDVRLFRASDLRFLQQFQKNI